MKSRMLPQDVAVSAYQWLSLALSDGPNRVGVSLPSPEDRNRSSFRNIVICSHLEFLAMDQKASDSDRRLHSVTPHETTV
jgi:hypothetical protein